MTKFEIIKLIAATIHHQTQLEWITNAPIIEIKIVFMVDDLDAHRIRNVLTGIHNA
jgi:1,2-phenylacetyl-CoA epoxidase catalytic subunit